MADADLKPLLSIEELIRPFEGVPPNAERPVCPAVHARLLRSLLTLEHAVFTMREGIAALPRHHAFVDGLQDNFAQAFDEAGKAYALFLATRDCEGEA